MNNPSNILTPLLSIAGKEKNQKPIDLGALLIHLARFRSHTILLPDLQRYPECVCSWSRIAVLFLLG